MHGEYDRAIAPRVFMTAVHGAAVAATSWLLMGGGLETVRTHWSADWNLASPLRRWLLFSAVLIYFLRVCATSFYLLKPKMGWSEAALIAVWIPIIDLLFATLGGPPLWRHRTCHSTGCAPLLRGVLPQHRLGAPEKALEGKPSKRRPPVNRRLFPLRNAYQLLWGPIAFHRFRPDHWLCLDDSGPVADVGRLPVLQHS